MIDLFGLTEIEVRSKFPAIYQRLLNRVKPERDANNRPSYREFWWVFGEPRSELRPALAEIDRYVVTVETSQHRFFQFLDSTILPDNRLIVVATSDASILGVLSSRIHVVWTLRKGGVLEDRPIYTKSDCFDPFPFPDCDDLQKQRIGALAEELDRLRKKVLAEHAFLTMTKLYNVLEKLKAGEPLDESERAIHDAGCVGVIHELHNKIDAAVAEAYGWPVDLSDDEILARLVALNKERAEEEKRGLVRWLRPEYQAPRTKVLVKKEQIEAVLEAPEAALPALPKDDADLVATLRRTLRTIGKPIEPKALAQHFRDGGKGVRRLERGLRLLVAAGAVRRSESGWFLPADRAV